MSAFRDMTGKKFGTLTVIGKADCRIQDRLTLNCKCDRGHTVVIPARDLKRRKRNAFFCKECDAEGLRACVTCVTIKRKDDFYCNRHGSCKKCEVAKLKEKKRVCFETTIRRTVRSAMWRSSTPSDIDEEFLDNLASVRHCELTGWPLVLNDSFLKPSIDQIAAGQGYTKDNVRIICYGINHMMMHYGKEKLLEVADAIRRNKYEG